LSDPKSPVSSIKDSQMLSKVEEEQNNPLRIENFSQL